MILRGQDDGRVPIYGGLGGNEEDQRKNPMRDISIFVVAEKC